MRACSICGKSDRTNAWVLVASMWPDDYRSGQTKGVSLCTEHYEALIADLARYNPEVV